MSKRKTDIYLRVISGAFVTIPEKPTDPQSAKMLIKIKTDVGEDILGFLFVNVESVNTCIAALERVRDEIAVKKSVHPKLKVPFSSDSH